MVDAVNLYEKTLLAMKAAIPNHSFTFHCMSGLADGYRAVGRHQEALKLCEETLRLRKTKLGPDHHETLASMWGVARALMRLSREMEALPVIEDCLARAGARTLDTYTERLMMDLRLRVAQIKKNPAGCLAVAERWEKLQRTGPDDLYQAAYFRGVCASLMRAMDDPAAWQDAAKRQADLAMEWLKKALAAGYSNLADLEQNPDLEAVRDRDDFKTLLAAEGSQPSAV